MDWQPHRSTYREAVLELNELIRVPCRDAEGSASRTLIAVPIGLASATDARILAELVELMPSVMFV